ncbi:MAG: GAF domain-containing protein [Desulfarculus sp.]|nr:GAF domain-containing protein [Desulfarculus sp.]
MRRKTREINYQTLGRISEIISSVKDMGDAARHIVQSLSEILSLKGCALLLLNRRSGKLEVASSYGLSQAYLNKGPLSAARSIAAALSEGPVVIYNVEDDPRLQYPEEAKREGIRSLVSVPLILRGKPLGVLRLYSAEPWEVSNPELTFLQAIAEIIALALDNIRVSNAYKNSIEVLKVLRPVMVPRAKRTLYE